MGGRGRGEEGVRIFGVCLSKTEDIGTIGRERNERLAHLFHDSRHCSDMSETEPAACHHLLHVLETEPFGFLENNFFCLF